MAMLKITKLVNYAKKMTKLSKTLLSYPDPLTDTDLTISPHFSQSTHMR